LSTNTRRRTRHFDHATNEPLDDWYKTPRRKVQFYAEGRFSGCLQLLILELIQMETWGANPKRDWLKVSVQKLADYFGKSRQAVIDAIEDAEVRRLIESKRLTKSGVKHYRMTTWNDVPKYTAPKEPQVEKPGVFRSNVVNLFPGSHSVRQLDLQLDGAVVNVSVECHNNFNRRISCKLETTLEGSIVLRVASPIEKGEEKENEPASSLPGEEKENEPASSLPGTLYYRYAFSSPTVVANKPVRDSANTQLHSPSVRPEKPGKNGIKNGPAAPPDRTWNLGEQLIYYRPVVSTFLMEHWGKALDENFLTSIVAKADGAPVNTFATLVFAKLAADRKARKLRTGILIVLAEDAARTHRQLQTQQPATSPQMSLEDIRAWEASLPPEDRAELALRGVLLSEGGQK
jgi:hypothetical protein